MRKLLLTAALAAVLLSAGSGCRVFCDGCRSSSYPPDLPPAVNR